MSKAPLNDSIQIRKLNMEIVVSSSSIKEDSPISNLYYHLATRRNGNAITGTCRGKEIIWVSTKLY